jgi:hypothetical protein
LSLPGAQRPVRRHALLATVSCTGPCLMGAYASVTITGTKPFYVYSREYRLTAAGSKTIPIGFSGGQLRRLRAALAAHRRIVAGVYGVTLDAAGDVQRETSGQMLAFRK